MRRLLGYLAVNCLAAGATAAHADTEVQALAIATGVVVATAIYGGIRLSAYWGEHSLPRQASRSEDTAGALARISGIRR